MGTQIDQTFVQHARMSLEAAARRSLEELSSDPFTASVRRSHEARGSTDAKSSRHILDVQEIQRMSKKLIDICSEAKHNKEEIAELNRFVKTLPFDLMEDLVIDGAQFNQAAIKLLQKELLAAQEAVDKHAARGKVLQLLKSGEVQRDLLAARQRIVLAFELLGVERNALAAAATATAGSGGRWRWSGVWQWVPAAESEDTLSRCSQEMLKSRGSGSPTRPAIIDAAASSRDVMFE